MLQVRRQVVNLVLHLLRIRLDTASIRGRSLQLFLCHPIVAITLGQRTAQVLVGQRGVLLHVHEVCLEVVKLALEL